MTLWIALNLSSNRVMECTYGPIDVSYINTDFKYIKINIKNVTNVEVKKHVEEYVFTIDYVGGERSVLICSSKIVANDMLDYLSNI